MAKPPPLTRVWAEEMAIAALTFVAGDPERLNRFVTLTGLDVGQLRASAAEPGFLGGVLDYLSTDEALLVAFATDAGIDPALVDRARLLLADG
jgi:hypothetical protein